MTRRTRFALLRRAGGEVRPADDDHPAAARRQARAAGATCWTQIDEANADGLPMTGQVLARPTGMLLGLRDVAEPVHRPAELAGDRPPAVRGTAAGAARPELPRAAAGRRRSSGSRRGTRVDALGPHLSAGRSAGLRAGAGEQRRRPRGARRPRPGGGGLRPAAGERRQGASSIRRSSTTPTATSTRCTR